jgi:hypothetical protein
MGTVKRMNKQLLKNFALEDIISIKGRDYWRQNRIFKYYLVIGDRDFKIQPKNV